MLRRVLLAAVISTGLLVVPAGAGHAEEGKCVPKDRKYAWFCWPWTEPSKVADGKLGPRYWDVRCGKARSAQDKQACNAVALTVKRPAPDPSLSVLFGAPATKEDGRTFNDEQVRCGLFAAEGKKRLAPGEFHSDGEDPEGDLKRFRAKRKSCEAVKAYVLTNAYLPKPVGCLDDDYRCRVKAYVKKITGDTLKAGIQGAIDGAVWSTAFLIEKMAMILDTSSPPFAEQAFYFTYNHVAGLMIFVIVLFFILTSGINAMRLDGPAATAPLGGLIRAFLGILFAGGVAWTLVWAWDEATEALLEQHASTWQPTQWVKALDDLAKDAGTALIALLLAFGMIIGLLLLLVQLLFRNLLFTAAALFGAVAMAGQVMPETRVWGRRWFWTVNALASSKFFAMVIWVYGSRAASQTSDLWIAAKATLLIWLMALAPSMVYKLTATFDSYMADVSAPALIGLADGGGGSGHTWDGPDYRDRGESSASERASEMLNSATSDIPVNPSAAVETATRSEGLGLPPHDLAGTGHGAVPEQQSEGSASAQGSPAGGAATVIPSLADPYQQPQPGSPADGYGFKEPGGIYDEPRPREE